VNDRDLLEAIREAGVVPPPPDRAGAFARALAARSSRRRLRRFVVALVAAGLAAVPIGVLAARGGRDGVPSPTRPASTPAEGNPATAHPTTATSERPAGGADSDEQDAVDPEQHDQDSSPSIDDRSPEGFNELDDPASSSSESSSEGPTSDDPAAETPSPSN